MLQELGGLLVIVIFRTHDDMAGIGRQEHAVALRQRLFGKGVVTLLQQNLQQWVFRVVSLQQDLAGLTGTAGAAGDLGIQLGKALGGTEVGREQSAVDIQQGYQRHIREMVALGQHLGADQNARAAAVNIRQMLFQRAFAAGGVAIDTGDRRFREQRRQFMFQLFCADADRHQMSRAALWALVGDRTLAVAVVAAQLTMILVEGVVMIAALALGDPAALVA
ncbi:hypothetical protein D3C73_1092570 [compost metagenome]